MTTEPALDACPLADGELRNVRVAVLAAEASEDPWEALPDYRAISGLLATADQLRDERDRARSIAVRLEQQLGAIEARIGQIAVDTEHAVVYGDGAAQARAAREAEPTWPGIKLAAYRAGYRLTEDQALIDAGWQARWLLSDPEGLDAGWIEWEHDEYGPGELWTYRFYGPKNEVTIEGQHVAPADVLAAARLAGLIGGGTDA